MLAAAKSVAMPGPSEVVGRAGHAPEDGLGAAVHAGYRNVRQLGEYRCRYLDAPAIAQVTQCVGEVRNDMPAGSLRDNPRPGECAAIDAQNGQRIGHPSHRRDRRPPGDTTTRPEATRNPGRRRFPALAACLRTCVSVSRPEQGGRVATRSVSASRYTRCRPPTIPTPRISHGAPAVEEDHRRRDIASTCRSRDRSPGCALR